MRKKIVFAALFFVSAFAFAQSSPSFSIRAGFTSAGMKGEAVNSLQNMISYSNGVITTGSRTAVFGGASVAFPLSNSVSIEPGLYYSQKGYEMRGAFNLKEAEAFGAKAKAELQSHYIDLPLLVRGSIGGLQVFAGPQVSYLAQADLRTTAGVLGFNLFSRKMDATEEFARWDAGVTGGIGYRFANGFQLAAAYDHGLSKADKNRNADAYTRTVKVGVGFSF